MALNMLQYRFMVLKLRKEIFFLTERGKRAALPLINMTISRLVGSRLI